jgi:membrane protein implicated in regulation of membrane protease activity
MSADPQNILNRKVSLARLAIGWERLLEAIFPAMMIAGLVLLAILTGVAGWLPAWAKLAAGAIAAAALLWSLTRLGPHRVAEP